MATVAIRGCGVVWCAVVCAKSLSVRCGARARVTLVAVVSVLFAADLEPDYISCLCYPHQPPPTEALPPSLALGRLGHLGYRSVRSVWKGSVERAWPSGRLR